jgi:hypothetical protein
MDNTKPVRIEYKRRRDIEHLRKCLRVAREIDFADNFHEMFFKLAHLSRIAKGHEDALYNTEVEEYYKHAPRGKGPGRPPKNESSKESDGKSLCEMMGGKIDGAVCRYTKYEVGAGNKRLSWDRSAPLETLDYDTHVARQYTPSKEVWENAHD